MTEPPILIRVDNVFMRYPVNMDAGRSLMEFVWPNRGGGRRTNSIRHVQALRGVSFEVRKGERVGIVGANGSGKSTLLRAISGVYPIDSGRIEVGGSLRSLFDINIGFVVDDTGRENIYNRGLLLGFSRDEIQELEAEIIDFADIGEFIDLPVRTYSTGMQVRLAFSISTALKAEVLLVDEVLGAGDAGFMRRARQRMQDVIAQAGCLVMVSHSMGALKELCTRIIWMDGGVIHNEGAPDDLLKEYKSFMSSRADEFAHDLSVAHREHQRFKQAQQARKALESRSATAAQHAGSADASADAPISNAED